MKKQFILLLGFLVAGLAAWAIPREYKQHPVKVEVQYAAIQADFQATVNSIEVALDEPGIVASPAYLEIVSHQSDVNIMTEEKAEFRWQSPNFIGSPSTKFKTENELLPEIPLAKQMRRTQCRSNL